MADLRPKRWFLPETPDVIGLLRKQLAVTIEGTERFVQWASDDGLDLTDFREIEARGEQAKRELLGALREAFITPIEPEDLYAISRDIGWILDEIGDLVGEAEVLDCEPDDGIARMSERLAEAVREIDAAVVALVSSGDEATSAADRAIVVVREMQAQYYRGMAVTLHLDDRGERIARRELYRRCSRIGDTAIDVAERVVYAVVKES